jgi:hypothetical protein
MREQRTVPLIPDAVDEEHGDIGRVLISRRRLAFLRPVGRWGR